MHHVHGWRRWFTLPLYFRAYKVREEAGEHVLEAYNFFGGLVRFYVDRLAGYDVQYTFEVGRVLRIDLDVDDPATVDVEEITICK